MIMSTDRGKRQKTSTDSKSFRKIYSLISDFKEFSKKFSKPKKGFKLKKKKVAVPVMPNIIRKESNVSDDSNDPKRRKNVLGALEGLHNTSNLLGKGFPMFGQSINEEPLQSDSEFSYDEDTSRVDKSKDVSLNAEEISKKSNNNFFYVHK